MSAFNGVSSELLTVHLQWVALYCTGLHVPNIVFLCLWRIFCIDMCIVVSTFSSTGLCNAVLKERHLKLI